MNELLQPGQIFAGRYRIEKYLAQGGFGAVYIAEQTATELRVAIKILWPHVLASEDAVQKFEQEARIAGRVRSEHIVRVFDAGFDDTTRMPFLVMELLEGTDLDDLVERGGAVAPDRVVKYLQQTARGLDKAHGYVDREGRSAPIVHRDLKPENLYLTHREDGAPSIKILDFGIAKVLSSTAKMSQEVKGTPLYMAFEQAGGGVITPRTDIWALGLIAFYLLTGRVFWKTAHRPDTGLMQLFGEVLTQPIPTPSERARELGIDVPWPPDFDAWFARCVNRDPEQRFATAGDAAAALAQVLGQPLSTSQPSVHDIPSGPHAASHPIAPAISTPTLASQADPPNSVIGANTDASLALERTAPSAGVQGPKKSALRSIGLVVGVLALLGLGAAFAIISRSPRPAAASGEPTSADSAVAAALTAAATPDPTVAPIGSADAPTPDASAPAAASPTRVAPTAPKTARPSPKPNPVPKPAGTAKPKVDEVYGER